MLICWNIFKLLSDKQAHAITNKHVIPLTMLLGKEFTEGISEEHTLVRVLNYLVFRKDFSVLIATPNLGKRNLLKQ